ncbi:hypothetical protein EVG20_g3864 [Dentipellis fragilis]|uniref:Uncharacterized protein n=1 Tax=Dentipellis fragilis TaxID=205917 RepID=A0A4Y9Z170_9AGAM|nr:hypothetical protein EVG20_g3864 [Dentipellis fragilis]
MPPDADNVTLFMCVKYDPKSDTGCMVDRVSWREAPSAGLLSILRQDLTALGMGNAHPKAINVWRDSRFIGTLTMRWDTAIGSALWNAIVKTFSSVTAGELDKHHIRKMFLHALPQGIDTKNIPSTSTPIFTAYGTDAMPPPSPPKTAELQTTGISPSPILLSLPLQDASPFVSSSVPSRHPLVAAPAPTTLSAAPAERTNTNTSSNVPPTSRNPARTSIPSNPLTSTITYKPPASPAPTARSTPVSLGAHTITPRPASTSPLPPNVQSSPASLPAPVPIESIPDSTPTPAPQPISAAAAAPTNLARRISIEREGVDSRGVMDEDVRNEAELEVAREEGARKRKRDGEIVRRLVRLRTDTGASGSAPPTEKGGEPDILAALDALESHVNSMNARLHIEEAARHAAERQLREDRRVLEDVRRECREPFVVPALLDAFVKLSRMGAGVGASMNGNGSGR